MAWAIYYGDLTRYTDQDGAPDQAPALDVAVVAMASARVGRILIDMWPYYVWRRATPEGGPWEWYGSDIFGLWDSLANFPGCIVRFGRTLPDAQFSAVHRMALEDDYLPSKSGRDARRERAWPHRGWE